MLVATVPVPAREETAPSGRVTPSSLIPFEILERFVDGNDVKTLVACSLVCSKWDATFTPRLHRALHIDFAHNAWQDVESVPQGMITPPPAARDAIIKLGSRALRHVRNLRVTGATAAQFLQIGLALSKAEARLKILSIRDAHIAHSRKTRGIFGYIEELDLARFHTARPWDVAYTFSNISRLSLHEAVGDASEFVRRVAKAGASGLVSFLSRVGQVSSGLEALAECSNLCHLHLIGKEPANPCDLEALRNGPHASRLRSLSIRVSAINLEHAFTTIRAMSQLVELSLTIDPHPPDTPAACYFRLPSNVTPMNVPRLRLDTCVHLASGVLVPFADTLKGLALVVRCPVHACEYREILLHDFPQLESVVVHSSCAMEGAVLSIPSGTIGMVFPPNMKYFESHNFHFSKELLRTLAGLRNLRLVRLLETSNYAWEVRELLEHTATQLVVEIRPLRGMMALTASGFDALSQEEDFRGRVVMYRVGERVKSLAADLFQVCAGE